MFAASTPGTEFITEERRKKREKEREIGREGLGGHRGGGNGKTEWEAGKGSIKVPSRAQCPPLLATSERQEPQQHPEGGKRAWCHFSDPSPQSPQFASASEARTVRPLLHTSPSTRQLPSARHERRAGARGCSAVRRRWPTSGGCATAAPRSPLGVAPPG